MTGADRPPESRGSLEPEVIELPAGTASPMVLALGITLIAAGLVTHGSVTAVGLVVALAGAVGWWRQVLPVAREERVPLRPLAERAARIAPSTLAVGRLPLGEGRHRMRVPVEV